MKYIILIVISCFLLVQDSLAFDAKNSVHTTKKDIELKRNKSLTWYKNNLEKDKFYGYDAKKHVDWLKTRALEWHENNTTKGKFYFVHSDKELAFTKKKATRWYDRNSQ